MDLVRDVRTSARWTIRLLAIACALLGAMCALLALGWRDKAAEAACLHEALDRGETPAIAESDCL